MGLKAAGHFSNCDMRRIKADFKGREQEKMLLVVREMF
jgi:hypothetical protein